MFDDFSGMFEVHTGNEWKKVAVKASAGLAAIVCGRNFENKTYCAEIVRFMYAKGYCTRVGTFGTESAVRKRGGSRNLPYLNAKPRQIPLLGTYA